MPFYLTPSVPSRPRSSQSRARKPKPGSEVRWAKVCLMSGLATMQPAQRPRASECQGRHCVRDSRGVRERERDREREREKGSEKREKKKRLTIFHSFYFSCISFLKKRSLHTLSHLSFHFSSSSLTPFPSSLTPRRSPTAAPKGERGE